mmetsp:Transcript_117770/g.375444  ORF Transcript_117770/g.375444 Transcript_117770/m.375444 type:complete len:249 (+) Transcript_117770:987-1733(+)
MPHHTGDAHEPEESGETEGAPNGNAGEGALATAGRGVDDGEQDEDRIEEVPPPFRADHKGYVLHAYADHDLNGEDEAKEYLHSVNPRLVLPTMRLHVELELRTVACEDRMHHDHQGDAPLEPRTMHDLPRSPLLHVLKFLLQALHDVEFAEERHDPLEPPRRIGGRGQPNNLLFVYHRVFTQQTPPTLRRHRRRIRRHHRHGVAFRHLVGDIAHIYHRREHLVEDGPGPTHIHRNWNGLVQFGLQLAK